MPLALFCGALVGAGAALITLPTVSAELRRRLGSLGTKSRLVASDRAVRLHASDLAIVGWTPTDLVTRQLLGVVVGSLGAVVVGSVMGDAAIVATVLVVGGAVGFLIPSSMLRTRAKVRRRSFVHAFSAYLDLVNVLLAGGAGIETALIAAAEAGDGWAFGTLRSCLVKARLSRRSPWHELRVLGTRWGIDEVVEVAGSMNLSGEHGARIRNSLGARADSMRARQVAEIEALAQSATERMGVPVMMLFVGFMVLLGYPALQTVVMTM
jgi:Flp pilus assembly protein TadB